MELVTAKAHLKHPINPPIHKHFFFGSAKRRACADKKHIHFWNPLCTIHVKQKNALESGCACAFGYHMSIKTTRSEPKLVELVRDVVKWF